MSAVLPLDPAADLYDSAFPTEAVDPDSGVVDDESWPLVLYQLETDDRTLRLLKTGARELKLLFY